MQMTSWQATTFLIGEYLLPESESSAVFTVADGILSLSQNLHRDSMVRKMRVVKMRGQAQAPGMHTFRITDDGIQVFPRAIIQQGTAVGWSTSVSAADKRVPMGIPGLDKMLGGGLPVGYSLLVVGPSGSGKTILATEFLAEGVRKGEHGVIAAFEKSPSQLIGNRKLYPLVKDGQVGMIDTRSLDLSIDETLHDLIEMINRMKAKRVVIDSLSGFELALAPEFSEDFRGSLYRMIAELTSMGVNTDDLGTGRPLHRLALQSVRERFSPTRCRAALHRNPGQLKRAFSVVKVRSEHSKDIQLFDISNEGIIDNILVPYSGIMTGQPAVSP
jgi:circadian clock protein KaiC